MNDDDYDCDIILDSDELKKIISNLTGFGDTCNIEIEREINFSVIGDLGKCETTVELPNTSTIKENSISKFSMEYLNKFTKATSLSNTVNIKMSNNLPIFVKYDFSDGYVKYYLVPKTEDD